MITRRFRPAALLGASMLALVLAVQPAAAAGNAASSANDYGLYSLPDSQGGPQGAACVYQTTKSHHAYPLKAIKAHGPSIYGTSSHHQWVGWRYRIQRDTNDDDVFGTYFTSSIVKAKATQNAPAAFLTRKWLTPSNLKAGNYRVQVSLYWYKLGSRTKVDGKLTFLINYYQMKGGGYLMVRQTDCYSSNTDVV